MSDDDETVVRQRLRDLLGHRAEPAVRSAAGPPDETQPNRPLPGHALPDHAPAAPADQSAPPPGWLGGVGAFDPGRRGVRVLAAVAAVVVLGAGWWAWRSRPQTQPIGSPSVQSDQVVDGPTATASVSEVVVAVAGKVHRPGLVRLPAGARVADALDAAGGALPGVDTSLLNLARKVADGELILVGVTAPPGVGGPAGALSGAGGAGTNGEKINLNTATLTQLDTLPGVGPVLAQRILDHRQRHGGFRSVGDLRQVDGIGDHRYQELKDLVTV